MGGARLGVDNTRIRANLKRAYETFPDTKFIRATLEFIRPCKNVVDYELLPYMRFGESK